MNKPNSPGAFSVEIKDWREKALQRAIMLKGVTRVGHTEIRWLDIELPVHCTGWARGASIDLIGVDTDDNYVLCELKFGGKGADSVEFAERELLGYVDSIAKNADLLARQSCHKNSRTDYADRPVDLRKVLRSGRRLIVAANKEYWEYWYPKRGEFSANEGIEWCSIDVDVQEFKRQRGAADLFVPQLPEAAVCWKLLNKD